MKLNPDSVRAILLYVEKHQEINNSEIQDIKSSQMIKEILKKDGTVHGNEADLQYATKQLIDNGMLNGKEFIPNLGRLVYVIYDITPQGHEFVKNIHNDEVWSKTKSVAKEVGSFSMKVLFAIAENVIAAKMAGL